MFLNDTNVFLDELKEDCEMPPPIKRICTADLRETDLEKILQNESTPEIESKDLDDLELTELELSLKTLNETTKISNDELSTKEIVSKTKVDDNFISESENTNGLSSSQKVANVIELIDTLNNDELTDHFMDDLVTDLVIDDALQENAIDNNSVQDLNTLDKVVSEDKEIHLDDKLAEKDDNKEPSSIECITNELIIETVKDVEEENKETQQITPFPLPFLRKYSEACGKLTFNELEQLALEKIAEVIIYRSDNRELQAKQEKQEKFIESLQQRLSHVIRQYSDMEIIHNQVLKDLELRNEGIIIPVKITRAVGLQVYQPVNRKLYNNAQTSATTSKVSQKRPNEESTNVETSPTTNGAQKQKRKAVHKITPMRPPLTDKEKANLEMEEQKEEQQIRINATKHIVSKNVKLSLPSNITVTSIGGSNTNKTKFM